MDECHVSPGEGIMIGNDGICDIQGAKQAGLGTLYVHSNISPNEEMPEADYVLTQMDMKKINSRKEVIYGKETGNIITAKIWKKY